MDFRTYSITKDDSGRRIDRVTRRFLPGVPLSGIYRLLRKGLIRIDNKKIPPDYVVIEGNTLEIASVLDENLQKKDVSGTNTDFHAVFNTIPVQIILETRDLLFINKPAGIAVHGEQGLDSLIPSSVSANNSLSFRTGPLHRLDFNTTGLITFSRSLSGAQWFSSCVSSHRLKKYYLGIVRGNLGSDCEWHDLAEGGKEMITFAVPLAHSVKAGEQFTLVRYRIVTGRKHQIRIQTSGHGFPLAGDETHKGGRPLSGNSYFLHAWQIYFPEDRPSDIPEKIIAPLGESFRECILDNFGELDWSVYEKLQ